MSAIIFGSDTFIGDGIPLLFVKNAGNISVLYPITGTPATKVEVHLGEDKEMSTMFVERGLRIV